MGEYIDLIGKRFGRLTVIERAPSTVKNGYYETWSVCKCDCGNTVTVRNRHLRGGNVRSCGCLEKENLTRIHKNNITHGDSKTRLYSIWGGIIQRCKNKNNNRYESYGGKGIDIAQEWLDYDAFKTWALENGYQDNLSIDRIDNSLGYYPDNCRWIEMKDQAGNKTTNHIISVDGEEMTIAKASEIYNIPYCTLWARICVYGWPVERAVHTAVNMKEAV